MAISETRFSFLDKETKLRVKDFTKLKDNRVYSISPDYKSTYLEEIEDNDLLDVAFSGLDDLSYFLTEDDLSNNLKDLIDSVINKILRMNLPPSVRAILSELLKNDPQYVRDFLKNELKIGEKSFDSDTGFLKLFSKGYEINENIISGLVFSLMLDWLDKTNENFSIENINLDKSIFKDPVKKITQIVEQINPSGELINSAYHPDPETELEKFLSLYSNELRRSRPYPPPPPMTFDEAFEKIMNNDLNYVLDNLTRAEMSEYGRGLLIGDLNQRLLGYNRGTEEYNKILRAIGAIKQLPLISKERRERGIQYENQSNKLGSYLKDLPNTGLKSESFLDLNDTEKGLYLKLKDLKETAKNNTQLKSTPKGSFDGFDFSTVLPALTDEEIDYILNKNLHSDSHRALDVNSTTEFFLKTFSV